MKNVIKNIWGSFLFHALIYVVWLQFLDKDNLIHAALAVVCGLSLVFYGILQRIFECVEKSSTEK